MSPEQVRNLMSLAKYLDIVGCVETLRSDTTHRYMRITCLTGTYTAHTIVQAVESFLQCHRERNA